MRCTTCQTDNPDGLTACTACSAPLRTSVRKSRRRSETQAAAPDNPRVQAYNRQVQHLYLLSVIALVPFLGVLLGPVAVALTWRLLRRGQGDPDFTAARGARWVRNLALATTATNWIGTALVVLSFYLD